MKIEGFSFGCIVIDGVTYRNDVIVLPPRVLAGWRRIKGHSLSPGDLAEPARYRPQVLVVGTGTSGMLRVPESTFRGLQDEGIRMEVDTTEKACRRFNSLQEDGVKVAGAFHITC